MDLIQQSENETLLIQSVDQNTIQLSSEKYSESIIIDSVKVQRNLQINDVKELTTTHIDKLLESNPEIVIFGSGIEHKFPDPILLTKIAERNIGFEVMTNQAAARTYNILKTEGRKLSCLLII